MNTIAHKSQPEAVEEFEVGRLDPGRPSDPRCRNVVVFQPGMQHSHQLAWALHEAGRLQAFWPGVPVRTLDQVRPSWLPVRTWQRMKSTGLDPQVVHAQPVWWLGAKLATRLGSPAARFRNIHRWQHTIDRWVAPTVFAELPGVFVGYENACLNSFLAAKKVGAACVLDAASFHYARGNELLESAAPDFQTKIDDWKQREIELADVIICCSDIARESYITSGVPERKVYALPLGACLPEGDFSNLKPPAYGTIRFAYAGAMHMRKSIDLVLACFATLNAQHPGRAELCIFGGSDGGKWAEMARRIPNVTLYGPVPQARLYRELAQCHALLLPSRYDSFGMVVPEALSVGTPAIVSTQTGAKSIIEAHPGSGWVVEPNLEAITQQITELLIQPEQLQQARPIALLAAASCTWANYRWRAMRVFNKLFPVEP